MRLASRIIPALLLAAAAPAFATSTITCRSAVSPTDGPTLSLIVGHGEAIGIVQASFSAGDERFTTAAGPGAPMIAQAWFDRHSLRLDIADSNAGRRLVRLDTRRRAGTSYAGILIHRGRTWRVSCRESG